jgi:hypothetical protein
MLYISPDNCVELRVRHTLSLGISDANTRTNSMGCVHAAVITEKTSIAVIKKVSFGTCIVVTTLPSAMKWFVRMCLSLHFDS